jgi:hypothetical protein
VLGQVPSTFPEHKYVQNRVRIQGEQAEKQHLQEINLQLQSPQPQGKTTSDNNVKGGMLS